MFTLKKLSMHVDKDSRVPVGTINKLPVLSLLKDGEFVIKNASIKDIEVSHQVVITSMTHYHRTSPIKEIVERTKDRIVFQTQTSLYELTYSAE